MKLHTLLKEHSIVGVVGNRDTGKTSLVLSGFKQLRLDFPNLDIAVMGLNLELHSVMKKYSIQVLHSTMDILDLRLKDTVIFVDEFALFFDPQTKSKQQDKLMRFFDRIEHNNCKFVLGTAREKFYNGFMCGSITAFLVKEVEYDALVNGTWLKERVKAITSTSDYRMECPLDTYYLVTAGDSLTLKQKFTYDPEVDTKINNADLFAEEKSAKKLTKKVK